MTLDQAIDQYQKDYTILDVINIQVSPSELQQRLLAIKKDSYSTLERILVVQHNSDVYEYADAPGRNIIDLQRIVAGLDISNFFVTVLTGNPDVALELEQVRQEYSTDDLPMQHAHVNLPYHKQVNKYNDTYCVLPWMHVYVGTNGDVLPCCQADQNKPLGSILNSDIDTIMQSESARALKQNMVDGYRSRSCASCYRLEDNQAFSSRQAHNRDFAKYISTDINSFDVRYLDLRINNICNFKCRMCSEYFSSAIAEETKALYGKDSKLKYHYVDIASLPRAQRQATFEKIMPLLTQGLEKIYFAGGEPLLCDEHYQILEQLIAAGRSSIALSYSTNLSRLQHKGQSVIDLWQQFENVTVNASIDASGAVAEYVRHGTVWPDIERNIRTIQQQCPHVTVKIASVAGFLNVESLVELQQSWIDCGLFDSTQFSISPLHSPESMSVAALPQHHKQRLAKIMQDHAAWCHSNAARSLGDSWLNLVNFMNNNDYTFALQEFRSRTQTLDHHRKESFALVFPQFRDLA